MPDDVGRYQVFSRAGAFMPDAFYSCLGLDEAAEAAHWPPFLKAAVEYWHEKYGAVEKQPGGVVQKVLSRLRYDNGLALKTFIYGMLTHQVADVSWHSLGLRQGMLQMLAHKEFGGDFARAHPVLDTGGDLIFVRRLLNSGEDYNWLSTSWTWPRNDVVEIFKRMGYPGVTASGLDYCMVRGQAALRAELSFARAGFIAYASQSPTLYSELESYYLGGMVEMTMAIRHCVTRLDEWFDKGPSGDPWDICEIFNGKRPRSFTGDSFVREQDHSVKEQDCSIREKDHSIREQDHLFIKDQEDSVDYQSMNFSAEVHKSETQGPLNPIILSSGMPQGLFGGHVTFGDFLGGACVAISAPYETPSWTPIPSGSVYVIKLEELLSSLPSPSPLLSRLSASSSSHFSSIPAEILSGQDYSRSITSCTSEGYPYNEQFSATTAQLKAFGLDLLVVSRPGSSKINVYFENRLVAVVHTSYANIGYGQGGTKQVGHSLLTVEQNGHDWLFIGCPYCDVNNHAQQGLVYAINGGDLHEILARGIVTPVSVSLEAIATPLTLPDELPPYAQLGANLAHMTVSGQNMLVVGAPGAQSVYGFAIPNLERRFTIREEDYSTLPKNPNGYVNSDFGGAMLVGGDGWLAVANSAEDVESGNRLCLQCGAVLIFRIDSGSVEQSAKLVDDRGLAFSRFAYRGAKGDDDSRTIYASSPFAQNEQGRVWKIMIGEDATAKIDTVVDGPGPRGIGFGQSLAVTKLPSGTAVLAVGIPYSQQLNGAVGLYIL
ncbi:hypothetical protein TRVA0_049S00804 [Trichomonascus vanleenenianus]|uniref:uncharacterized protein n=1 Tax=Trichomonascus vanleenenianus TaxID=2268995 RepID=UPI003ECA9111